MKPAELVRQARAAASALKKAAVWNGSGLPVDAVKDDYLYELLCYFLVALAARKSFAVQHRGPNGQVGPGPAVWPRKPGKKSNFSYLFLAAQGGVETYQLCPGIRVTDRHGKDRAPDINLLKGACGKVPTYVELLGCWDAKYVSGSDARLPDTAVSDFAYTVEELGNPTAPPAWVSSVGPPFARSGLLTNGKESTEKAPALAQRKISETSLFPLGPVTRP